MLSGMDPIVIFAVVVIGYLIGSIPAANLLARRSGSDDLRHVGDRNPGYWNARTTLGRRTAVPIFIADVAKGTVAAGVGVFAATGTDAWWLGYVGGGAAMVGHAYPVFDRWRGGRSVLCFVGTALVVAPLAAAGAITVLAVVFIASRRFDLAARVAVAAFPIVQIVIEGPYRTAVTGVLMSFIGLRFGLAALADRNGRARTADV